MRLLFSTLACLICVSVFSQKYFSRTEGSRTDAIFELHEDGELNVYGSSNPACYIPSGLDEVVDMCFSGNTTIALRKDGSVISWLSNTLSEKLSYLSGDLRVRFYEMPCTVPADLRNIVSIKCKANHCIALKSDSTVVTWGSFHIDSSEENVNVTFPSNLKDIVSIHTGYNYFRVFQENGTVISWGSNDHGQCSVKNGLRNSKNTNYLVMNDQRLDSYKDIDSDHNHAIALKQNGEVVTWGKIYVTKKAFDFDPFSTSELMNVPAISTLPSKYKRLFKNIKSVHASNNYHSVYTENKTLITWGYKYNYDPSAVRANHVGFDLESFHIEYEVESFLLGGDVIALKNDGSVVAWGNNYSGQTDVPYDLKAVAIYGGNTNVFALQDDGSVVAWGGNEYEQCNIPYGLKAKFLCADINWSTINAIQENGEIISWGNNPINYEKCLNNTTSSLFSSQEANNNSSKDSIITPAINAPPPTLVSKVNFKKSDSTFLINTIAVIGKEITACDGGVTSADQLAIYTENNMLSHYSIIDRRHLEAILDEHRLQMSGLTIEKSLIESGCIQNAQAYLFVQSGCLMGDEMIEIRLVHCETSSLVWSCTGVNTSPQEVMKKLNEELSK